MTKSMDLIYMIQEKRHELSKAERRLVDTILADIEFTLHASLVEIAERAQTSNPTLTRLCRHLGFSGFKEFKLNLAQSMAIGARYHTHVEPKNIEDVSANVIKGVEQALQRLHGQLNFPLLDQAVAWIVTAPKVVVFGGGGGSSIVAQDAEYRLFRLGINAVAYNDSQLQRMVAATLKDDDILIAISTSGRNQEIIECAAIAKEYHAKVIAITRSNSPLGKVTNLLIPVDIPEHNDILQPTESRYALLAIVDILATEAAYQKGDVAAENLRRIKYQLVSYRDEDDSQPLGD